MEENIKCKIHENHELCLYCETCNIFICIECLTNHSGHVSYFYKALIPSIKLQIDKENVKLNLEENRSAELLAKINSMFKNTSKIANESKKEQDKILASCLNGIEKLDHERMRIFSKGIRALSNFIVKINEFRQLCKQKVNKNSENAGSLENNPNVSTVIKIKNNIDTKFDYNYANNLDFERQMGEISREISDVNVTEPSKFICENILLGEKEKLENSLYKRIKRELVEENKVKLLENDNKISILFQKISQLEAESRGDEKKNQGIKCKSKKS